MGTKSSLLFATLIASASVYISLFWKKPELPKHYLDDHYWGPKSIKDGQPLPKDAEKIEKFTIKIDESVLDDLKSRLNKTRLVDSVENAQFQYGFNSQMLRTVLDYWLSKYDWRSQEKILNMYDNYKTQIEGISVHFVHIKAKSSKPGDKIVPILMVHGWPGSFWEFYKIIPMLNQAQDGLAFELIIPSIPGYGFSEAPSKPGFNTPHAARIFAKLMHRLGHKKYYYHGGDWGAIIGEAMAKYYPQRLSGLHITMTSPPMSLSILFKLFIGSFLPQLVYHNPGVEATMLTPFSEKAFFMLGETGYMHIQSTKPDTVGTALNDSPAGLAAYILEKFSTWVNPGYVNRNDGGLFEKFTPDELLTNIMIYWVTESITSSQRFYKETVPKVLGSEQSLISVPVKKDVPVGVASFPYELLRVPRFAAQSSYENLIHYEYMPRGGHFGAFEEPQLTAEDIRKFVKKCIEFHQKRD